MTREQAINYLRSSGMTDEQIDSVANAFESKAARIREIIEEMDLKPMSRDDLWRETRFKDREELEHEIWYLYSFYNDVKDILGEGENEESSGLG